MIQKLLLLISLTALFYSCSHTQKSSDTQVDNLEVKSAVTAICKPLNEKKAEEDVNFFELNPYNVEKYRTGRVLNFNFSGLSLIDVLGELSRAFSVPIVVDPSVETSDEISAALYSASFLDALEVILQTTKLTYNYNGRYFYISEYDPRNADSLNKMSISTQYKPRFVQPEVLITMLPGGYKDNVKAVKELDTVAINSPIQQARKIIAELRELDVPSEQILLKLNIIEVEKSSLSRFGHYLNSMGTVAGGLNSLSPVLPALGPAVLTKTAAFDFLSTVNSLSGEGVAKVMAAPKIITKNGEKAEFKSVHALYVASSNVSTNGNGRTVAKIDTSLEFMITPYLKSESEIFLDISNAKIGILDMKEDLTPEIKEHSVKTKISVKPGETVLIGGMVGQKNKEMTYGVPLLQDIPYLGWLFKSRRTETKDVEIFFTLTPEVVCY